MIDTITGLEKLNTLPVASALENFMQCCASLIWAHQMVTARPFPDLDTLHSSADSFWSNAVYEDMIEAFDGHPRIGNTQVGNSTQMEKWFNEEQAAVNDATESELADLRKKNLEYEQKFGFTFIVHAEGKSIAELNEAITHRLSRSLDEEADEAIEQQRQIIHARLDKLVNLLNV